MQEEGRQGESNQPNIASDFAYSASHIRLCTSDIPHPTLKKCTLTLKSLGFSIC